MSRITMETIQKKVVDYYHLRMADMLSRRRPANIAFPRQIAMYLSRMLTEHSLQEIGSAFGEEITAQLSMPAKPWKT